MFRKPVSLLILEYDLRLPRQLISDPNGVASSQRIRFSQKSFGQDCYDCGLS